VQEAWVIDTGSDERKLLLVLQGTVILGAELDQLAVQDGGTLASLEALATIFCIFWR
jgi:hypothetical protein